MHWYYPPTPTLRRLEPATWAPWLAEVRAVPPVTFDRSAAAALLGHAHRILREPVPYRDDPAAVAQREGPAPELPPFHALCGFEVVPGWRFEMPSAPDGPWWFDSYEWMFDLPPERERVRVSDDPRVPVGSPGLFSVHGRLAVGPHVVRVEPFEEMDEQDLSEELDHVVEGITGFVAVDRDDLLVGPFRCPVCGAQVQRLWEWEPGEPMDCDDCGADVFSVRALPSRPVPSAPPRRRLDVLVELGLVELCSEASRERIDAVERAGSPASLLRALLGSHEVAEVYGDDDVYAAFLAGW